MLGDMPQSTGSPVALLTSYPRAIIASRTLASCMYSGAPRQEWGPMPNVASACRAADRVWYDPY